MTFTYNRTNRLREIMSTYCDLEYRIPDDIQVKIVDMFEKIQEPFDTIRLEIFPNTYIPYRFFLYKISELLNEYELKKRIRLPKTKVELSQHDIIWKRICEKLEWNYCPTSSA